MKHQIALVGGQLLPVFVGIKEFSPDLVHFIVSSESKEKITPLMEMFKDAKVSLDICDPYEFNSIKQAFDEVLKTVKSDDDLLINLTGGTKIMLLAAQSQIHEKRLNGFYINQDNSFLLLPDYSVHRLSCEISAKEVLAISGHRIKKAKVLGDFSAEDIEVSEAISQFSDQHDRIMQKISDQVRRKYEDIPKDGELDIDDQTKLAWTKTEILITSNRKELLHIRSANVRSLFFYASWWEILVARECANWENARELFLQCELPFKADPSMSKNEIDVLINAGGRLVFIECKSGLVRPEDVNKMNAIKDTYGGLISKSLLACRHKPAPSIIEKCVELGTNLFYLFENGVRVNNLSGVVDALKELELKRAL